jgi:hypothetical protein
MGKAFLIRAAYPERMRYLVRRTIIVIHSRGMGELAGAGFPNTLAIVRVGHLVPVGGTGHC